jgi:hypothetical protein
MQSSTVQDLARSIADEAHRTGRDVRALAYESTLILSPDMRAEVADLAAEQHVGHVLHFTGAWYCDTCDSPYCDLA